MDNVKIVIEIILVTINVYEVPHKGFNIILALLVNPIIPYPHPKPKVQLNGIFHCSNGSLILITQHCIKNSKAFFLCLWYFILLAHNLIYVVLVKVLIQFGFNFLGKGLQ